MIKPTKIKLEQKIIEHRFKILETQNEIQKHYNKTFGLLWILSIVLAVFISVLIIKGG